LRSTNGFVEAGHGESGQSHVLRHHSAVGVEALAEGRHPGLHLRGLGFTLFGVTHVLALANGQGMLTKETWEMLKTPQIWIRGIGYFLVLLGMLV
jgi:hypothetical protein